MSQNITLKNQIRQELMDTVKKKKAAIKELEETVRSEMFLRSTVTGGALSTAARKACDARANAARQKIAVIKASMAWQEEMLKKYQ